MAPWIALALAAGGWGCEETAGGPDGGDAADVSPETGAEDAGDGGDAAAEDAGPDARDDASVPDCVFAPDPLEDAGPPAPPAAVDYLIVAAEPLLPFAQELADYRAARGHTPEVLSVTAATDDGSGRPDVVGYVDRIRARVAERRAALDPAVPLLVLLFGDADETWEGEPGVVPAGHFADPGGWVADVTSDNLYVDLDADDLPDAAVGRVPVRTEAQAQAYLDAVQAYEATYRPGLWNRQLHVFAGIGGFGDLIEDIFLDVGMEIIGELSPEWSVTFIYARQDSPYTYPPERYSDRVYDYLNAGGLMMTYIGHGSPGGFDRVEWEGGPSGPIFDTGSLDDIAVQERAPFLVFVACSTGSFDTGDSISERILRQPRSSTAVLSSTEVSHPYYNTIFIREVERVVFQERPRTLGDAFLRAKRAMVEREDALREYIDSLAELQMTVDEMAALTPSHLHMYSLLGDPGLEIPFPPGSAEVTVAEGRPAPGSEIHACVQVHGPPAGTAHLSLEIERTELARWPDPWTLEDADWEATCAANHESANDKVVWQADLPYENGGLAVTVPVPAEARTRDHYLVVRAEDGAGEAIGAGLVRVR